MSADTQLVTIEPATALTVFTERDHLDPLLERIAAEVRAFVPDITTAKGRKEIASLAFKVAQSKTYLDGVGKALVDQYKEVPKKIDASRKAARDYLDALKDEVRAPLDAWEAEQARIAAEKAAAEEAERIRLEIDRDHEIALLMDAEFNRQREERARIAEQERIERERQVAADAERRAREEAEQKVVAARVAQERAEQAAREAAERAERERAEAAARAERAAAEAVEAERRRVEAAARAEAEEQARREANLAHRKTINRAALAAVVNLGCGISEDQGKAVITAIIEGRIPAVVIHY